MVTLAIAMNGIHNDESEGLLTRVDVVYNTRSRGCVRAREADERGRGRLLVAIASYLDLDTGRVELRATVIVENISETLLR